MSYLGQIDKSKSYSLHHDFDLSGERALWASVLLVAISDAQSSTGCGYRDHLRAIDWIGDYPSRDFRLVCDLAGLDADVVHPILRRQANAGLEKTQKRFPWLKKAVARRC